jgi:putative endonuclease
MQAFMYYVYIIRCSDGNFYTGITWNLRKRFREHQEGKGALFTKSRLPLELVYYEELEDKYQAAAREKIVKDMSRKKKLYLINTKRVYFERSEKRK